MMFLYLELESRDNYVPIMNAPIALRACALLLQRRIRSPSIHVDWLEMV